MSLDVKSRMNGDFNGDKKLDGAYVVKTKEKSGNPNENETADEYTVFFADNEFQPIIVGCCGVRLINEGDLNGDGGDEITFYQAPMNGSVYTMTTYTFFRNSWRIFIDPFIVPTGGNFLSEQDTQDRIFLENGKVYYFEADLNNEEFKLVKKECKINAQK
jgi:hypothetical protein